MTNQEILEEIKRDFEHEKRTRPTSQGKSTKSPYEKRLMTEYEILKEVESLNPTWDEVTMIEFHIIGSCPLKHYQEIKERATTLGYTLVAASKFAYDEDPCVIVQFAKLMPYEGLTKDSNCGRIREVFTGYNHEAYCVSIAPGTNGTSIPFVGEVYYMLFPVKSLAEAFPTKI